MLETKGLVTTKEAAEGLGVTRVQLKNALDRCGIKYIKLKRGFELFSLEALNMWLTKEENHREQ